MAELAIAVLPRRTKQGSKIPARLFRCALRRRVWAGSIVPLVLLLTAPAHASPNTQDSPGPLARHGRSGLVHAAPRHSGSVRTALRHAPRSLAHRPSGIAPSVAADDDATVQASDVIDHGIASWYGGRHNGRLTSSGARFDDTQLTAAHAWLPLGSRVRVTAEATGSSVVVTINDRQRSCRRVIDLSKAAAEELGMRGRGLTLVTITHS